MSKKVNIHIDIQEIENGEFYTHVFNINAPRDGFKAISKNKDIASDKAWSFALELAGGNISNIIFC